MNRYHKTPAERRPELMAAGRWAVARCNADPHMVRSFALLFETLLASLPGWPCPVLFGRLWEDCALEVLVIPAAQPAARRGRFSSIVGDLPFDALNLLGPALRSEIILRGSELMVYSLPCGTEVIAFLPEVRATVLEARNIALLAAE